MSPTDTAVELDLDIEDFWTSTWRCHLAASCVLEGLFEDGGAMPAYRRASSTRRRLVGPTREGCHSTIEPRFTRILCEGDACQAQRGKTNNCSKPWSRDTVDSEKEREDCKGSSRVTSVWGLDKFSYLDWSSLPQIISPKPPVSAAWYTCP